MCAFDPLIAVEIDEELLSKAQQVLCTRTPRETVEESPRRALAHQESQGSELARRQAGYLNDLERRVDPDVLRTDEMWP